MSAAVVWSSSAFQLDEPDFMNWKAIGGFYNACLLRRPARRWSSGDIDERLNWATIPERRLDAALTSNRPVLFSRCGRGNQLPTFRIICIIRRQPANSAQISHVRRARRVGATG